MGAYPGRAGLRRRRSVLLGSDFIYVLTVREIYEFLRAVGNCLKE